MMRIAAIIPVLNEAQRLPALLTRLQAIPELSEIVVVDGNSSDQSVAVAQHAGVRVVQCAAANRSAQLNAGVAATEAAVLWFVHADTVPALTAGERLIEALRDERVVGGAFRRRFATRYRMLRWTTTFGDLRARLLGVSFGDQAQFVRRSWFEVVGGFRACDRAEDMDLALRLRRCGKMVCLGPPVHSSDRRFAGHPWRTVVHDSWLTWRYWSCSPCRGTR